jgi:hypothetical protein
MTPDAPRTDPAPDPLRAAIEAELRFYNVPSYRVTPLTIAILQAIGKPDCGDHYIAGYKAATAALSSATPAPLDAHCAGCHGYIEALRTAHPAATRRAAQGEDYFTALADEAACRAATAAPSRGPGWFEPEYLHREPCPGVAARLTEADR